MKTKEIGKATAEAIRKKTYKRKRIISKDIVRKFCDEGNYYERGAREEKLRILNIINKFEDNESRREGYDEATHLNIMDVIYEIKQLIKEQNK